MKRFIFLHGSILAVLAVVLIAAAVRLYRFPSVPPALNWDEVSIGYNAYSILKTGRDEFGTAFPKYFRSLDDYKMPVYIYLTSVSEALFGYNDFAVRFPSAAAGFLLPIAVFALVWELSHERRRKVTVRVAGHNIPETDIAAVLAALLVAVQPWNVQFSRMASEANLGLLFLIAGIWLFLAGVRQQRTWMVAASVVVLGVCSYTYLSYRVLAPLLGLILVIMYRREIMRDRRMVTVSVIVALVVAGSLITDLSSRTIQARFSGTSVLAFQKQAFGDTPWQRNQEEMAYDATLGINVPRRVFHDNAVMESAGLILRGYFIHFSPDFLFFDSTQRLDHTPFVGLMYVWMIILIPVGAYALIQTLRSRQSAVVAALLFITPVPAALTWDVPHPIRTMPLTIPFAVMAGFGLVYLYRKMAVGKLYSYLYIVSVAAVMGFSLWHYSHQYLVHLPHERSEEWQYGRQELADYLSEHAGSYDRIIVSPKLEWPYIFLLYYSKYDPQSYLRHGGTVSGGWGSQDNRYGKYEFRALDSVSKKPGERILEVGAPEDAGVIVNRLKVIDYLDGTPAIYIGER